jgi:hypothetical protein
MTMAQYREFRQKLDQDYKKNGFIRLGTYFTTPKHVFEPPVMQGEEYDPTVGRMEREIITVQF